MTPVRSMFIAANLVVVGCPASSDPSVTEVGATTQSTSSETQATTLHTSGASTLGGDTSSSGSPEPSTAGGSTAETSGSSDEPTSGTTNSDPAPGLAFPGARGFGAKVTGGRGGRVIKVTNLDADGPGSLQDALEQNEPRIIIFAVSGVIEADPIEIPYGDVTIAGQSAPGAGITLRGRLYGAYAGSVSNIVIRHLRIRPVYDGSDGEQYDGVQFSLNHHFIFDHVSISGGVDETVDLYSAYDATIQWSTIESSATQGHPEGQHNYGLINGPDGRRVSLHHNLFAHHRSRAPAIANGPAEVINNVVYNVRHAFVHNNPASGAFDFVGNTFRTGSDDELFPFYFDDENASPSSDLSYYIHDNWLEGTHSPCIEGELTDPWAQCEADLFLPASYRADARQDFSSAGDAYVALEPDSASDAAAAVLARAGAFPRDIITLRSVAETLASTGSWGARIPGDLLEGLVPGTAPADEDNDGMADDWERALGLDPDDGEDHRVQLSSGYSAIETYLNELADALTP